MNRMEMSMIDKDEEHLGQFSSAKRALLYARMEGMRTGCKQGIILTTTYRNLIPRICWGVYLWRHSRKQWSKHMKSIQRFKEWGK